jgi:hypothetical protein
VHSRPGPHPPCLNGTISAHWIRRTLRPDRGRRRILGECAESAGMESMEATADANGDAYVARAASQAVALGRILDFWNPRAKHDSPFQKSLLLSHRFGGRPGKQARFANRVLQKCSNSRLKNFMGKVPKFTPCSCSGCLSKVGTPTFVVHRPRWPAFADGELAHRDLSRSPVCSGAALWWNRIAKQRTVIMNLCVYNGAEQVQGQNWPPCPPAAIDHRPPPASTGVRWAHENASYHFPSIRRCRGTSGACRRRAADRCSRIAARWRPGWLAGVRPRLRADDLVPQLVINSP